ncbi:MAG: hypothetical protein HUU15_18280, partial [Candidatus Brocadiae bacterium]|nr:hypothetical protein [Candidatus Brocadiia bacterium]
MTLPALLLLLFADIIHLKDGRVWNGEIVEEQAERVRVRLPKGAVWVARAEIEKIETTADLRAEYARRSAAAAGAEAHRELARWCRERSLEGEERREWEAVVQAAPDDPEGRKFLGHVRVDGVWMSAADAARARGLVERDGALIM